MASCVAGSSFVLFSACCAVRCGVASALLCWCVHAEQASAVAHLSTIHPARLRSNKATQHHKQTNMPLRIAQGHTFDDEDTRTWSDIGQAHRLDWDATVSEALQLEAIQRSAAVLVAGAKATDQQGQQERGDGAKTAGALTAATQAAATPAAAPWSPRAPLPPLVYVHQREIALVSPRLHPHVALVGSADATTCVILLLQCAATKRVICSHFDGADRAQIWGEVQPASSSFFSAATNAATSSPARVCTSLLDALNQLSDEDCSAGIEVHMAGGFQTHRTGEDEGDAEAAEEEQREQQEEAEEEEEEDATDQSDGLVQVRELLRFLDAYSAPAPNSDSDPAAGPPRVRGCRAIEFRVRTLCVGPLNTQWKADAQPAAAAASSSSAAAAVAASSSAAAASSGASSSSSSSCADVSYPRPCLTCLFLDPVSGVVLGGLGLGRGERGPHMALRTLRSCLGPPNQLAQPYDENTDQFVTRAFKHAKINVHTQRSTSAANAIAHTLTLDLATLAHCRPGSKHHLAA